MSTRDVDGEAIRTDLLAYLRTPGFVHFEPSHVADYGGLGQVWVKTRPVEGCERDLIFDYRVPVLTIEYRCAHEHLNRPPDAYITEVKAISATFAGFGDQYSTVVPTRNRPIPPNQPPHPTLP